nr:ANTAR domain-containing protein [Fumia xinanensis]
MFYQAIKLISASRRRILGLKNENVRLQKKIEEIRLVDRAKCALIEYLGMTEAQAHRHIEKQAMDLRMTRREVAQGILQTYES